MLVNEINNGINFNNAKVTNKFNNNLSLNNLTVEKTYEQKVSDSVDVLVAKFYAKNYLPRSIVIPFINDFQSFYYDNFTKKIIKNSNDENITKITNVMNNAFQNYKTEKKAFNYLKKLYYIEPKSVNVGTILIPKRRFKKKYLQSIKYK